MRSSEPSLLSARHRSAMQRSNMSFKSCDVVARSRSTTALSPPWRIEGGMI